MPLIAATWEAKMGWPAQAKSLETPSQSISQAECHIPEVAATREAYVGGLWPEVSHSKNLRPCLKNN
jgi:hypothetical protein